MQAVELAQVRERKTFARQIDGTARTIGTPERFQHLNGNGEFELCLLYVRRLAQGIKLIPMRSLLTPVLWTELMR